MCRATRDPVAGRARHTLARGQCHSSFSRCAAIHRSYNAQPEERVIKKLVKHGNSYALIIDKPIMDLLGITPTTPLEITTDGQRLIITPIRKSGRRSRNPNRD